MLDTTISRFTARGERIGGYLLAADRGRYFITGDDANIIRLDMPFEPSGKWRAAAVYTSRGAYLSDWRTFADAFSGTDKPLRFKSGKAMYYLGDLDHGTSRVWGVGIGSVRRANFSRCADGYWREDR